MKNNEKEKNNIQNQLVHKDLCEGYYPVHLGYNLAHKVRQRK